MNDLPGPIFTTQIDFDRFEAAFLSEDVVGAVVRCQYEMERAARRALTSLAPKYHLMKHRYLSDHLKTFRALGCEGPIFQVAEYVNKVRNEFAHDGIELLTDQHLRELCSQAGKGFGGRPVSEFVIEVGVWGLRSKSVCQI
jgi:hypothetical protein